MNVAIIGSGHVGLVAAAGLAELGHNVICHDTDHHKIATLQQGKVPIHERFLAELLDRHRDTRIRFTTSMRDAVQSSGLVFISVGTPSRPSGEADLSWIEAAVREMAPHLDRYTVIVQKSTVPACTNEWLHGLLARCGVSREHFDVVSNPEFLREGTAVTDFLFPDRIVIGTHSERATQIMHALYRSILDADYGSSPGSVPEPLDAARRPQWLVTSPKSAELIKHASNAFLALKVSYINAVANLCEAVGAEVDEVCEGIGSDRRIGGAFMKPGLGFGGSCFPKDLSAFQAVSEKHGAPLGLLQEVQHINQEQQRRFVRRVRKALSELDGKKVAALGLAYKGGTDDLRQSPALAVVRTLHEEGCCISAYDPAAGERARAILPDVSIASDAYEAARDADALLILTDWEEFANLDLPYLRGLMKQPLILDGRNLYPTDVMRAAGFTYLSVGRATVTPALQKDAGVAA